MPATANAKCKELFPHEDVLNLNKFYGDPSGDNGEVDPKWFKENIVAWTPPYPMFFNASGQQFKTMKLHKKVVNVFDAAFKEVLSHFGPENIKKLHLDQSGGSYNYRLMRGSDRLSVHAWGIAIDMDPARNPYPQKWKEGMINRQFCDILMKHGICWRGLNGDIDAMHFQCAWRY